MGLLIVPKSAALRNPKTGEILSITIYEFYSSSNIFSIFCSGSCLWNWSRKNKGDKDIVKEMSKTMSSMGGYIVLVFFAAQFVAYFAHSNIGTVIAVKGADFLKAANISGLPLIVGFILITAFYKSIYGISISKMGYNGSNICKC